MARFGSGIHMPPVQTQSFGPNLTLTKFPCVSRREDRIAVVLSGWSQINRIRISWGLVRKFIGSLQTD